MSAEDFSIIIIDDEEMIRETLEGFFDDEGYQVQVFETGEEGLEAIEKGEFDLAIVDVRLPGIDGNETVLKAHELNSKLKFFMHTGSSEYELPKELVDIGLTHDHIILKPVIDMDQLIEAVERVRNA